MRSVALSFVCSDLVSASCPDEHTEAFENVRLLQGAGVALAFALSLVVQTSVKLYILIALLVSFGSCTLVLVE